MLNDSVRLASGFRASTDPHDTLALVEGVGHPNVMMMLDLYHAQIGEGNLIDLVRRCGDAIGEIQVADVPGRCEPGTGEVFYPAVAGALRDIGYRAVAATRYYFFIT